MACKPHKGNSDSSNSSNSIVHTSNSALATLKFESLEKPQSFSALETSDSELSEKPQRSPTLRASDSELYSVKFEALEETQRNSAQKSCSELRGIATGGEKCGGSSISDLPSVLVSEILQCLDAKELGIVSCVSTSLHKIASDHQGWKKFYFEQWGAPVPHGPQLAVGSSEGSWKDLFVEREFRSKTFLGRYSVDALYGHTEAVRSVFMLVSVKLIVTGGYDSIVRLWDMEEGLLVASSRPLKCTIRAVAADTKLLVVGGTDGYLQCWRAVEGLAYLFDITSSQLNQNSEFRLWEHQGPVTCVALDLNRIYSGSWDMTVRIWDRVSLKCVNVLMHSDWVWSLVPRDTTIVSTAGVDVYIWDIDSGNLLTAVQNAHAGNVFALARSHTGNLIFTGGEDGTIHMYEIFGNDQVLHLATWSPHTGAVQSLAFEFPWLVSASTDGKLALIDIKGLVRSSQRSASDKRKKLNYSITPSVEAPQRMLPGFGSNLFSVEIGCDRIVCGGEEGSVRIWNFSQALEIERRVQALRGRRLENRMRRRKAQIEMNNKGRADQCSVTLKKTLLNGDRVWHGRRATIGKPKA